MRWDSPSPDGTTDAVPSVFGLDAVTRTFDTPEFRGITFHEVRARWIVNGVPGASRMPESPSGWVPTLSQVATPHGRSQEHVGLDVPSEAQRMCWISGDAAQGGPGKHRATKAEADPLAGLRFRVGRLPRGGPLRSMSSVPLT